MEIRQKGAGLLSPVTSEQAPIEKRVTHQYRDVVTLPSELAEKIFSYQNFRGISSCRQVSRSWRGFLDAFAIPARAFYRDHFPLVPFVHSQQTAERDYLSIRHLLQAQGESGREVVCELDELVGRTCYFREQLCYAVGKVCVQEKFFDPERVYTIQHASLVENPRFSPSGDRIASLCYQNHYGIPPLGEVFSTIRIDGHVDGEWRKQVQTRLPGCAKDFVFSPDGNYFAVILYHRRCEKNQGPPVHSTQIWKWLHGAWYGLHEFVYREPDFIAQTRFSPCGRYLVILSRSIEIFEHNNGPWQRQEKIACPGDGISIVFSPDQHHFLATFANKTFKLFACINGKWQEEEDGSGACDWEQEPCFSPRGDYFAVLYAYCLTIWGLVNGKWQQQQQISRLVPGGLSFRSLRSLSFNPDGTLMVSTWDNTLLIWECCHAEQKWQIKAGFGVFDYLANIRVSPDQEHFAMYFGNTVLVCALDGKRLQQRAKIEHADRVTDARFSADGQHLITASVDKTAMVFSHEGRIWWQKQRLQHPTGVRNIQLSPNGNYLLTTCEHSNSIHLRQPWRFKSGAYDAAMGNWSQPAISVEHKNIL